MLKQLFMALPEAVRRPLLRSMFSFDAERASSFTCRLAETYDDYVQAFTVLRSVYQGGGITAPYRSKRVHYWFEHMLPTSNLIVEQLNGEIVGTATSVRDSWPGLHSEQQLTQLIAPLRRQGRRLGEASSVAVVKEHRAHGEAFFALLRYYTLLTLHIERLDVSIISTRPLQAEMMRTLFGFTPLAPEPVVHPMSDGQKTWLLMLDMSRAVEVGYSLYGGRPLHRNLAHYLFEVGKVECVLPSTPFHTTMGPRLAPDEYRELFGGDGTMIPMLDDQQRIGLRNALGPELERLFPGQFSLRGLTPREPRFEADGVGTIDGKAESCRLRNVSRRGVLLQTTAALRIGSEVSLDVEVGPGKRSCVIGRVVRETTAGRYGLALTRVDAVWDQYLDFLQARLWGRSTETSSEPVLALSA